MDTYEQIRSAVERGDVHDFAEALERGADREFAYREALKCGNADMVRLMLDSGADANAKLSDVYQYQHYPITPLMIAVWKGHEELVKLLLERGADPKCEHRFGKVDHGVGEITPLGKAIEAGSIRMVEMLLDGGASPFGDVYIGEQGGPYGQAFVNAVEWAGDHGRHEIRELIEERQKAVRQKFLDAQAQKAAAESAPASESAEAAGDEAPHA
jgi:ankyrin repeat protein